MSDQEEIINAVSLLAKYKGLSVTEEEVANVIQNYESLFFIAQRGGSKTKYTWTLPGIIHFSFDESQLRQKKYSRRQKARIRALFEKTFEQTWKELNNNSK